MAYQEALISLLIVAVCSSMASAMDPANLQDFCVADFNVNVMMNGFVCKNPVTVQASDFSFSGLHISRNTSNVLGSKVTLVTVAQIPGLNTLGISLVRIDFAPRGVNPPHAHPRTLEVGFVTSNPDNRLISKILHEGDVFAFPIGLIHYQRNVGYGNAVAIAGLNSQNPGVVSIASSVFGSKPDISNGILAKAFQVDKHVVKQLQTKF
ncbi:Putative germin-like protein 2-1 [Linum grandiflorum]